MSFAFFFFFFFNKGKSDRLVKFSECLPVTAGKDVVCFSQLGKKWRLWSCDYFFLLFSSRHFFPWHWKVCLFDKLGGKQHICDPRRSRKICLITGSSDTVALVWILEVISLKYSSSECPVTSSGLGIGGHGMEPVNKRNIWALHWPSWGMDLISNRLFQKASLLALRCAPIHHLLKNSGDKEQFQSVISWWHSAIL